jgi:hypothetical protein
MNYDRLLIQYLPDVLKDVREYQALMFSEQPEFSALYTQISGLLNNQFVETSDEYGVKRWEKMLKIVPKSTCTLDERKFNILSKFSERLPYTYRIVRRGQLQIVIKTQRV